MSKKMLIDAAHPEEVRVALLNQGKVEDFDFESQARKPLRGNIYLARVTRVEPSLQAAFVDYGGNRHGFLAFSEIHPDYYQIPVSDRKILQDSENKVAELAAKLEFFQRGDEHDDEDQDDTDEEQDGAQADSASTDDESPSDSDDEPVEADASPEDEATDETLEASDETVESDTSENDTPDGEVEEEDEEEIKSKNKLGRGLFGKRKLFSSLGRNRTKSAASEDDQPQPEIIGSLDSNDDDQPSSIEAHSADDDDGHDSDPDGDQDGDFEDFAADDDDSDDNSGRANERHELLEQYKAAKRERTALLRNYKIQEVIKRRQILLIQVVREERGNKGAALTTYMSLAGRYCVLMPNTARGGGISRKIPSQSDRRRLRRCVDSLDVPQGMGLIIRTAGAKRTKAEIKRDYDYLLRLWETIRTLTLKSMAPCLIYEEASLIKRAIRDLYDKDISSVTVEGEAGYREAKDFMKMLMPSHAKNVQPHKDRAPIFLRYNVENQLDAMFQPTARLKSGGYLVIHQTEALVAIDVNSGRATRERNIEQTALRTNVEAATEAARQFRLRDLAGLIVIDFIDMEEPKNNRKVEKALKDALRTDRARIQVGRISSFGLLEMSRQRRRSGIVDGTTHSCPACQGGGVVRSNETAALRILRAIEGEAVSGKAGLIVAKLSLEVGQFILNKHRQWLQRIESENGVIVEIAADDTKFGDAYDISKSGTPEERPAAVAAVSLDQSTMDDEPATEDSSSEDKPEDGKRRRRRRRGGRNKSAQDSDADQVKDQLQSGDDSEGESSGETDNTEAASADGEEEPKRKRRRRGRRGGRRNKRPEAQQSDTEAQADGDAPKEPSTSASEETAGSDGGDDSSNASDAPIKSNGSHSNGHEEEAQAEPQPKPMSAPVETTPPEKPSMPAPKVIEEQPLAVESEPAMPPKPARKGWWQTPSS